MGKGKTILFVVYIILAIYFLNGALNFVSFPEFITKIDKWLLFLGGIFLVFGGINFLKSRRTSYRI